MPKKTVAIVKGGCPEGTVAIVKGGCPEGTVGSLGRWWEWASLAGGAAAIIFLVPSLWARAERAFLAPSGAAHFWAIGVAVLLLSGIIGVSMLYRWIRSRELAPGETEGGRQGSSASSDGASGKAL